ncbi:TonB-dependent receptor [Sphingomonas morindae]|uniref:TonB-dependent receptor n=1 Tax=Sphingomonas morindae TaxID=1541170 RepID=A0ABY4XCP9_9SPHN|nr:TonB-dependent receptor [Sphingomonas morindae]USI74743.1 TonB-dependent receptor [Sphingomonas morindae]
MKRHALAAVSALAIAVATPALAQQDPNASVAGAPGATQLTTPARQQSPADSAAPVPGAAAPLDSQVAADPAAGSNEIIVTGLRASLSSAATIKRQAPQIVDSIVAEDIGKLPDNTVSDALQRVTGVQIIRGGGEATAVLVRGLPNAATLLNGREAFTGAARGIALQDIPAELIAGVDVYKTATPDIVEGGVVGVIDVRLRRPFDFNGLQIAGGGRAVYSDQSKKWSGLANALVSDRWQTGLGEFGALAGFSFNRRIYRDDTAFDFISNCVTGPTGACLTTPPFGNSAGQGIGIPDTVGGLYTVGQRQRLAFNGSLQWKPADNLEFYADGLYTQYKNRIDTNFFVGLPKTGVVTNVTTYDAYPALANGVTETNAYTLSSMQAYQNKTTTIQGDVGAKWNPGEHDVITAEIVYNHSKLPNRNLIVDTSFNAPTASYNFDNNGTPLINIGGVDLTNPANFTLRTLFDNHSLETSRQWAYRADVTHSFDGGLLSNFKFGVRYTDRRAESQATVSTPIGITNPVLLSSVDGLATLSPGDLVQGRAGIDRFALSDADYLLSHADQIRGIFSQPAGDRPFDPNLAFFDSEKTYAFYGQAGYRFDIGGIAVDGVAGVRVVNTVEDLEGNGVSSRENYLNALPSATLRAKLTGKLQFRLAYAKTLTRPNFSDLNPLVGYASNGVTGGTGTAYTGSGGNPGLGPIKADNYDASLEWYLTPTTSLTAAGFYKTIKGYIQVYSAIEPYQGQTALVSRPRGVDGTLKGLELAYQQFFDFLPGPLSGLGAQLNGTYIIGRNDDPINGGKQRLVNVSKYSYNAVAIYEKYGVSARLAWNWRSSFAAAYNSGGLQAGSVVARPTGQLDLSVNYAITPFATITFDATNLTDRVYHDEFKGLNSATGVYSTTPRDTRTYDRTFEFGARFKF